MSERERRGSTAAQGGNSAKTCPINVLVTTALRKVAGTGFFI